MNTKVYMYTYQHYTYTYYKHTYYTHMYYILVNGQTKPVQSETKVKRKTWYNHKNAFLTLL